MHTLSSKQMVHPAPSKASALSSSQTMPSAMPIVVTSPVVLAAWEGIHEINRRYVEKTRANPMKLSPEQETQMKAAKHTLLYGDW